MLRSTVGQNAGGSEVVSSDFGYTGRRSPFSTHQAFEIVHGSSHTARTFAAGRSLAGSMANGSEATGVTGDESSTMLGGFVSRRESRPNTSARPPTAAIADTARARDVAPLRAHSAPSQLRRSAA